MWDFFISHASEDKDAVARPLYDALCDQGYSVWFDEATLSLGDSLRQKIDEGLSKCSYGIVIISNDFLSKPWPQRELDALVSREDSGSKVILPVWHEVTHKEISLKSPLLASKLAAKTSSGIVGIVKEVEKAFKPSSDHIHEPLLANLNFSLPEEPNQDAYYKACEEESLFIEYCNDVLSVGDFQIGVTKLLREGVVETGKVNEILNNFTQVFSPKHYRVLFQLGCLLYDYVDIEDNIFDVLGRKGVEPKVLESLSAYIPNKSSYKLSRIFFNAFYELKTGPIEFGSALRSDSFALYCSRIDNQRTLHILQSWRKASWFTGALVADAVSCVVDLVDKSESIDDIRYIKYELKNWGEDGLLDENMNPKDYAWDGVRRILGW
ncbi:toll/interleukin-1 receptor domain-containing protein [uncultured Pseudoteredinibacter sp.]|uniref:toll/interleukin-1 receptor domain-containing protein n=1 Tax=uncultured Pseudoteredinibacter sp. TaxID=1641701 RepID=UPI002606CB8A|nr:toll/interleukin-1 receptor domain-containing protein [uncultured Pseudoteredinibacter sp.]